MLDHTTLRRASFGLAALVLLLMALSLTAASAVQAAVPLAASAAKIATPAPSGSPTITPAPSAVCGPQGWRVISSPNPSTVYDGLFAVGVVAPNDIWAAGAWEPSPGALVQPLLEHWNGTSWSVVPNPGTAPEQSQFFAIGVVNATDIWAAGYVRPAQGIDQTLFEHWNGSAWTISPGSRLPSDTNGITGLAVVNATDIWAVSPYSSTLHWDGSTWTAVPGPGHGWAATALAANDAWAVGYNPPFQHWDGQTWIGFGLPDTTTNYRSVAARSPNDVWAVGTRYMSCTLQCTDPVPVSAHWDGQTWTAVPVPTEGGMYMLAVTTVGATDAWAVGATEGPHGSVIWHWDGTAWTIFPNPDDPPTGWLGSYLNGIAAAGPDQLWAVGAYYPSGHDPVQTFTEHYRDTLPVFSDVRSTHPFYAGVEDLVCRGIVSGYTCGGPGEPCDALSRPYFRPAADVTRAQLVKMVVAAAGWPLLHPPTPTFADAPADHPFYAFVETAVAHGIISGYSCGGPGEPCDAQQRPYFRPAADVTRAQASKMLVLSRGWAIDTTGGPHFLDVPASDPFYGYIETAYNHGVISGYADGTFRPGNQATRGQIAKIVDNAMTSR